MKIKSWYINDTSALSEYLVNEREILTSEDPQHLYIANAMLLDHIIDSIEPVLSEDDIELLQDELEIIAKGSEDANGQFISNI